MLLRTLQILSGLALALLLLSAILYFNATITKPTLHWLLLANTLLWFATAPFWMSRKTKA